MTLQEIVDKKLTEKSNLGLLRGIDFFDNFDEYLDFSSNDYLCLSKSKDVQDFSINYIKKHGTGTSSSPILLKNSIYKELCDVFAKTQNKNDAILFSSGYVANFSSISAIVSVFSGDCDVFCDRLNHASIHDSLSSIQARQIRYKNTDLNHLEDLLKKSDKKNKIVITESVFSMDGSVIDIDGLIDLKRKFGFILYIDEAHSFGVFGKNGYGISQKYSDEIDFFMTSFSKSCGSSGGGVVSLKRNIKFLENFAKGFIYSTAQSPASIGSSIKSISMFPSCFDKRSKIFDLSIYFQEKLDEYDIEYIKSNSQIIGILHDNYDILNLQKFLESKKIIISAIREPTVPKNTSRLRVCINSSHEKKDFDRLVFLIKSYKNGK